MTTQRRKRPNSRRDKEIHHAVKVLLVRQKDVALQYNVSQPRISQIIKAVGEEMDEYLFGEDLGQLSADAQRARRLDWACQERREEDYRHATTLFQQYQKPRCEIQRTYDGPEENNQPVKTVVKSKETGLALEALKVRVRLNDQMQREGRRPPGASASGVREHPDGAAGAQGRTYREAHASRSPKAAAARDAAEYPPPVKRPLPDCLPESDRSAWNKLPREVQDLAAERLALYPGLSFHHAIAAVGAHWSYYPWRSEAEHNSAGPASQVIKGRMSIEEYLKTLERVELDKPLAHPNVLRKDKDGQWTYIYPQELPLPPVLPPARAALPENSPEWIYWPYKSKAEHYAMLRAEMVLRGDLSREQYDSLNQWAERMTGDKYPDPLARIEKNLRSSADCGIHNAECQTPAGVPLDGNCSGETQRQRDGEWEGAVGNAFRGALGGGVVAEAEKAPTGRRGAGREDVPSEREPIGRPAREPMVEAESAGAITLTAGQGFQRRMSERELRRMALRAEVRAREAAECTEH